MKIKIKICCIGSLNEARIAINAGASAIGLVSAMPSGPGVINEDAIKEITSATPAGINTFLLTSLQDPYEIIAQQKRCCTDTIQLCDRIQESAYNILKKNLPGISIIQVIHVKDEESYKEAKMIASNVDALLLDSGNQEAEIKILGGTGKTHNWEISKKITEDIAKPIYLAGGLNKYNVVEAIKFVRPYGIDVCSGVRINGKLDKEKVEEFIQNVRK